MSDNATLYNCCTDYVPPDWSLFDWLETGGCTTETDSSTGFTYTNGGIDDNEAEFWTVYAHLKEGGCEAITDCKSRAKVDAVADELSRISGLEVR